MQVIRKIDELTIEEWIFSFINGNIILNSYQLKQRQDKAQRKYRTIKNFNRFFGRDSNIEELNVPFPDDVKKEALEQFVSDIKVLKWGDRNK
jgi:hypothetical protein